MRNRWSSHTAHVAASRPHPLVSYSTRKGRRGPRRPARMNKSMPPPRCTCASGSTGLPAPPCLRARF